MATTTNVTTTYAGQSFSEYISAVLMSMSSMEHIKLRTNIRYKEVVKKFADTVALATENCDFTPTGTVTVTERIIEPIRQELARQFCKNDFYNDWDDSVGTGGWLDGLGNAFEDYIANYYGAALGGALEVKMWQGTTGGGDPFDGFSALFAADADVNDVALPLTLSAANIIAETERLIDVVPTNVLDSTDQAPKIYMNGKTFRFMQRALYALGIYDAYQQADVAPMFEGYEIAVCNGIADDKMYMAQPDNLWAGVGVDEEWRTLKIVDMTDTDASDNVRVRIKYTFAVQHGIGGDIGAYNA